MEAGVREPPAAVGRLVLVGGIAGAADCGVKEAFPLRGPSGHHFIDCTRTGSLLK